MIDPLLAAAIGMAVFLTCIVIGMPVGFGLGFGGAVGIFLMEMTSGMFWQIGVAGLNKLWSNSLLAIPLFVLMGTLIQHFGFGRDIYNTAYKCLGGFPGGLAIASTIFGALFGCVCGSSLAGTATIGTFALPEMEARNYNRRLALGTISLAGSLAILIPPSIMMIIYATHAECSMGHLFFAGVFPGLTLAGLMSAYIIVRVKIDPSLAPSVAKFSTLEKVRSLIHLTPLAIMFFGVLGGIYLGLWSPVEGGAGGASIALLLTLAYRRFSWSQFQQAVWEGVSTSSMIALIIVGAGIISLLFFLSGFHELVSNAILGLDLPRWGIILVMLLILMFMGMFLDVLAMILITIPIFIPVVLGLGYDIIWFGIVIIISSEMAMITPPVGLNLFVLKTVAPKGVTMTDIVLGALPFVAILWLLLALLIAFPEIALWLPSTMTTG